MKQEKLLKKVKRLLSKARLPRFLHHYGPKLYELAEHVPVKKGVWRGVYRRKHAAAFRTRTYHRRSLIESCFSRLKRTQGQAVKNRLAATIRTEITLRFINDNMRLIAALTDIFNKALKRQGIKSGLS